MVAKHATKTKGKNDTGIKRTKIAATAIGRWVMVVILAAITIATIISGIYGKIVTNAIPQAALEKIIGKIFPPRQPQAKQIWVNKILPTANNERLNQV